MALKLKRVVRLDSLALNQTYFTKEGYLVDRPILTSTGIFEYANPDGTIRRELRLPEEVFDRESLKSYKGKPIVITHDAGLITKENVHEEIVGTILSEGYQSGENVRAEIIIHDTDEMKSAGLKELSLGYNLDLDETPGIWDGQPYDAVQRNISINHLALVLEARAGEQARLNIDGRSPKSKLKGEKSMKGKVQSKKGSNKKAKRADGVLSPEELAAAIEKYKARRAQRLANQTAAKEDEEDDDLGMKSKATVSSPEIEDDEDTVVTTADEDIHDDTEAQVQLIKDRRDRRDAEPEPKNKEQAMGVIAQQDGDIECLFDIIDTLLAAKDFDGCTKDGEGETDDLATRSAIANDEDEEEDYAPAMDGDELEEESDDENLDDDDAVIPATNASEAGPPVLNADSVDTIIRQRVQLGIVGRALHMDGLENMRLSDAKKAVIRAVRPSMRLDGKSKAYIDAAFDCAVADVKAGSRKGISYQKRQMFNKDSRGNETRSGSYAARQRMIDRQMNKKKEEK